MYKLICNNISKSKGSLTSFTSPCRKVAKNYEGHSRLPSAARRCFKSEHDLRGNATESPNEGTNKKMKTASYSSFFRNEGARGPLLEISKKKENTVKTMMTATSASKYFFSSLIDQDEKNSEKKKTFKNKQAVELYKKALEQCTRIKNNKYKLGSIYRTAKWYPKPIKPGYSWEEKELQNAEEVEVCDVDDKIRKQPKIEQQPPPKAKSVVQAFEGRKLDKAPVIKDIESIGIRKPSHQFRKKKTRISYPTHTVNYNIARGKPYHIDGLETNQQVKITKPEAKEEKEEETEEKEEEEPKVTAVNPGIQRHPTFERVTKGATRAIAAKYNKLLYKIFAKNQKVQQEPLAEEHTLKAAPAEELPKPEEKIEEPTPEPRMIQHPVAVPKRQKEIDIPLTYPKRILVDKREMYDIETICMKPNGNQPTYDDYAAMASKKAERPPIYKSKPTSIKTDTENKGEINKEETKEEKAKEDIAPQPSPPEGKPAIRVAPDEIDKIPTALETLAAYLRKLNELKDQTALDKTSTITTARHAKGDDLSATESKSVGERAKSIGETMKTENARKVEEQKETTKPNETERKDPHDQKLVERLKNEFQPAETAKPTRPSHDIKNTDKIMRPDKREAYKNTYADVLKRQMMAARRKAKQVIYPALEAVNKQISNKRSERAYSAGSTKKSNVDEIHLGKSLEQLRQTEMNHDRAEYKWRQTFLDLKKGKDEPEDKRIPATKSLESLCRPEGSHDQEEGKWRQRHMEIKQHKDKLLHRKINVYKLTPPTDGQLNELPTESLENVWRPESSHAQDEDQWRQKQLDMTSNKAEPLPKHILPKKKVSTKKITKKKYKYKILGRTPSRVAEKDITPKSVGEEKEEEMRLAKVLETIWPKEGGHNQEEDNWRHKNLQLQSDGRSKDETDTDVLLLAGKILPKKQPLDEENQIFAKKNLEDLWESEGNHNKEEDYWRQRHQEKLLEKDKSSPKNIVTKTSETTWSKESSHIEEEDKWRSLQMELQESKDKTSDEKMPEYDPEHDLERLEQENLKEKNPRTSQVMKEYILHKKTTPQVSSNLPRKMSKAGVSGKNVQPPSVTGLDKSETQLVREQNCNVLKKAKIEQNYINVWPVQKPPILKDYYNDNKRPKGSSDTKASKQVEGTTTSDGKPGDVSKMSEEKRTKEMKFGVDSIEVKTQGSSDTKASKQVEGTRTSDGKPGDVSKMSEEKRTKEMKFGVDSIEVKTEARTSKAPQEHNSKASEETKKGIDEKATKEEPMKKVKWPPKIAEKVNQKHSYARMKGSGLNLVKPVIEKTDEELNWSYKFRQQEKKSKGKQKPNTEGKPKLDAPKDLSTKNEQNTGEKMQDIKTTKEENPIDYAKILSSRIAKKARKTPKDYPDDVSGKTQPGVQKNTTDDKPTKLMAKETANVPLKTQKDLEEKPLKAQIAAAKPHIITIVEHLIMGGKMIDVLATEYLRKCRSLTELLERQKNEMLEEINRSLGSKSDTTLFKNNMPGGGFTHRDPVATADNEDSQKTGRGPEHTKDVKGTSNAYNHITDEDNGMNDQRVNRRSETMANRTEQESEVVLASKPKKDTKEKGNRELSVLERIYSDREDRDEILDGFKSRSASDSELNKEDSALKAEIAIRKERKFSIVDEIYDNTYKKGAAGNIAEQKRVSSASELPSKDGPEISKESVATVDDEKVTKDVAVVQQQHRAKQVEDVSEKLIEYLDRVAKEYVRNRMAIDRKEETPTIGSIPVALKKEPRLSPPHPYAEKSKEIEVSAKKTDIKEEMKEEPTPIPEEDKLWGSITVALKKEPRLSPPHPYTEKSKEIDVSAKKTDIKEMKEEPKPILEKGKLWGLEKHSSFEVNKLPILNKRGGKIGEEKQRIEITAKDIQKEPRPSTRTTVPHTQEEAEDLLKKLMKLVKEMDNKHKKLQAMDQVENKKEGKIEKINPLIEIAENEIAPVKVEEEGLKIEDETPKIPQPQLLNQIEKKAKTKDDAKSKEMKQQIPQPPLLNQIEKAEDYAKPKEMNQVKKRPPRAASVDKAVKIDKEQPKARAVSVPRPKQKETKPVASDQKVLFRSADVSGGKEKKISMDENYNDKSKTKGPERKIVERKTVNKMEKVAKGFETARVSSTEVKKSPAVRGSVKTVKQTTKERNPIGFHINYLNKPKRVENPTKAEMKPSQKTERAAKKPEARAKVSITLKPASKGMQVFGKEVPKSAQKTEKVARKLAKVLSATEEWLMSDASMKNEKQEMETKPTFKDALKVYKIQEEHKLAQKREIVARKLPKVLSATEEWLLSSEAMKAERQFQIHKPAQKTQKVARKLAKVLSATEEWLMSDASMKDDKQEIETKPTFKGAALKVFKIHGKEEREKVARKLPKVLSATDEWLLSDASMKNDKQEIETKPTFKGAALKVFKIHGKEEHKPALKREKVARKLAKVLSATDEWLLSDASMKNDEQEIETKPTLKGALKVFKIHGREEREKAARKLPKVLSATDEWLLSDEGIKIEKQEIEAKSIIKDAHKNKVFQIPAKAELKSQAAAKISGTEHKTVPSRIENVNVAKKQEIKQAKRAIGTIATDALKEKTIQRPPYLYRDSKKELKVSENNLKEESKSTSKNEKLRTFERDPSVEKKKLTTVNKRQGKIGEEKQKIEMTAKDIQKKPVTADQKEETEEPRKSAGKTERRQEQEDLLEKLIKVVNETSIEEKKLPSVDKIDSKKQQEEKRKQETELTAKEDESARQKIEEEELEIEDEIPKVPESIQLNQIEKKGNRRDGAKPTEREQAKKQLRAAGVDKAAKMNKGEEEAEKSRHLLEPFSRFAISEPTTEPGKADYRLEARRSLAEISKLKRDLNNQEELIERAGKKQKVNIKLARDPRIMSAASNSGDVSKISSKRMAIRRKTACAAAEDGTKPILEAYVSELQEPRTSKSDSMHKLSLADCYCQEIGQRSIKVVAESEKDTEKTSSTNEQMKEKPGTAEEVPSDQMNVVILTVINPPKKAAEEEEQEISETSVRNKPNYEKIAGTQSGSSVPLNKVRLQSLKGLSEDELAECYYKYLSEDLLQAEFCKHLVYKKYKVDTRAENRSLKKPAKIVNYLGGIPYFKKSEAEEGKIETERIIFFEDGFDDPSIVHDPTLRAEMEEIFERAHALEKFAKFNKHLLRHISDDDTFWLPHLTPLERGLLSLYDFLVADLEATKGRETKTEAPSPVRRNCSIYIEKQLPSHYTEKKQKANTQAVMMFCSKICLPPKTIPQVIFERYNDEESMTLNRGIEQKTAAVPRKQSDVPSRHKKIQIMHMIIRRPGRSDSEHFLPAALKRRGGSLKSDPRLPELKLTRAQLMEFRRRLLQKLHKEFPSLPENNKLKGNFDKVTKHYHRMIEHNKMADTGTPSSDGSSAWKPEKQEVDVDFQKEICNVNVHVPYDKAPKTITELLIKKVEEQELNDKRLEHMKGTDDDAPKDKDDDKDK